MDVEDFLAAMQFGHQHESCCQLHSKTAQLREALRLKKAGMDLRFTPASAMAVVVGSRWGSPAMELFCSFFILYACFLFCSFFIFYGAI